MTSLDDQDTTIRCPGCKARIRVIVATAPAGHAAKWQCLECGMGGNIQADIATLREMLTMLDRAP